MTQPSRGTRTGFTLVEMLVAVALVLLMMTMFAEIFKHATDAISLQRSMANNDQKARSVTTILRADLDKRTMRTFLPFFNGEDSNTSPNPFGARQGYFSVSTNDSANGTDDVLQFTVSVNNVQENADESPYYGRATQLFPSDYLASITSDLNGDGSINNIDALLQHPNQPEADDARVEPDATAQAPAAEISYFLRGGNLYRRVLLIREPLELAGQEVEPQPSPDPAAVPAADTKADFFDLDDNPATVAYYVYDPVSMTAVPRNNFWADFDFAAFRHFDTTAGTFTAAMLHGIEALNNEAAGSSFFSLGKPQYRWGYNTAPTAWFGMPREFTVPPSGGGPTPEFMGRFLHEETSFVGGAVGFGYPQSACVPRGGSPTNGHPMDTAATPLSLTEERHVVEQFTSAAEIGGPRRAEELLLAGVHEFRVEVWDDRLRKFVGPGHAELNGGVPGDYHISRRWNTAFGPFGPATPAGTLTGPFVNRTLDSWHPSPGTVGTPGPTPFETDGMTALDSSPPPYRAMEIYPPTAPNGPSPPGMPGPFATNSGGSAYWMPNTIYEVGDIVFPLTEDLNDNGHLDPGEDGLHMFPTHTGPLPPPPGTPWPPADSHAPSRPTGFSFYYRCVQRGRSRNITMSDQHDSNAPNWQTRKGALIAEDSNGMLPAGQAQGSPGAPVDGEPIWVAVPNLRPVRAIRVTLRFLDQGTERMRQVSITHSLVN